MLLPLNFWMGSLALLFVVYLVILASIDLKKGLLPDVLTLSLLWLGLLANSLLHWISLASAVWGAALGYGLLWLVYWVFKLLRHKEGLGFGDCKFLAALGAWWGWQAIPLLLFIASVSTLLVLGGLRLIHKYPKNPRIPFGPGLSLAGFCLLIKPLLTFI